MLSNKVTSMAVDATASKAKQLYSSIMQDGYCKYIAQSSKSGNVVRVAEPPTAVTDILTDSNYSKFITMFTYHELVDIVEVLTYANWFKNRKMLNAILTSICAIETNDFENPYHAGDDYGFLGISYFYLIKSKLAIKRNGESKKFALFRRHLVSTIKRTEFYQTYVMKFRQCRNDVLNSLTAKGFDGINKMIGDRLITDGDHTELRQFMKDDDPARSFLMWIESTDADGYLSEAAVVFFDRLQLIRRSVAKIIKENNGIWNISLLHLLAETKLVPVFVYMLWHHPSIGFTICGTLPEFVGSQIYKLDSANDRSDDSRCTFMNTNFNDPDLTNSMMARIKSHLVDSNQSVDSAYKSKYGMITNKVVDKIMRGFDAHYVQ